MDAEDAVEAKAYELLNVDAVKALTPVFQHVPQDTKPPVLIIADMDSEPIATKGGIDQKIGLNLIAVFEGEERRPLRQLKAVITGLLHQKSFVHEGWQLQFIFVGSDGFLDPESGEAYVENFRFDVLAFAT